jgi:hypothetical protein
MQEHAWTGVTLCQRRAAVAASATAEKKRLIAVHRYYDG